MEVEGDGEGVGGRGWRGGCASCGDVVLLVVVTAALLVVSSFMVDVVVTMIT